MSSHQPPDSGENVSDAFIFAQLFVVSTLGTATVAYQSGRQLAKWLPLVFVASVLLGLHTLDPISVPVAAILWSVIVVIPSAAYGVRLSENREGRWVDRILMRRAS